MKKGILLLLTAIIPLLDSSAQETMRTDSVSVKVYFRQGYSVFDPEFRDNGARLSDFALRLRESLQKGETSLLSPLRIVGSASPEGSNRLNTELARKRALNTAGWIKSNLGLDSLSFETGSTGVDWLSLTVMVEESGMPYRTQVLDILKNTPVWVIRDGKVADSRVRQLGMLQGGRPWFYMDEHFFPELRSASVEIICSVTVPDTTAQPLPAEPECIPAAPEVTPAASQEDSVQDTCKALRDSVPAQTVIPQEPAPATGIPDTKTRGREDRRPFSMAVKTNMLYDLALIPNIGAEFYLGRGWTLGANWMYAWWKNDRSHYYWRTYGGDLNIRKYFGSAAKEKPFQGHHLGVYGQIVTYDLELGGRGYLGDRWSWGAGIEYGYSLPVARRLNIDFSIGAGYLTGEYKEYLPIDTHYVWQATRQRHWFGPTKLEISLVWLLGKHNCNEKGGSR